MTECNHCHIQEEKHWLFFHEPSAMNICQNCLAIFLAGDIEKDDKANFDGFTFVKIGSSYQVTNDEYIYTAATIDQVVEDVLIKLKLI